MEKQKKDIKCGELADGSHLKLNSLHTVFSWWRKKKKEKERKKKKEEEEEASH